MLKKIEGSSFVFKISIVLNKMNVIMVLTTLNKILETLRVEPF